MWRGLYNFLTDASVRNGVPAGRFFASRVLRASKLSSFLAIPRSGYKLRFYPSAVSALLWSDPAYGSGDEAVLRSTLRPGDVFVDVGANVGHLTLAASSMVGPQGLVFSLEPHPKTVHYLRGNVAFNRAENVRVIHAAAGESDGATHFTSQRSDDLNFVSDRGIRVPLVTLDSVLPPLPIRLLKVDVEGAELMVLKGAAETLARTEFIYFEAYEKFAKRFGYSTSQVFAFLRDCGFTNFPNHVPHSKHENILASRSPRPRFAEMSSDQSQSSPQGRT
jgi:FkbM family methyltransferase